MGFNERKKLYKDIEQKTGRPLICYITSDRQGADGRIAGDTPREFIDQLSKLPDDCKELDIWINSMGGDGLSSWRMISLIREKLGADGKLRCLVPHHAFSAATLFALGTDEIFMHPSACLGPVDPQITVLDGNTHKKFAYEDLVAFGEFVGEELTVSDDANKTQLYDHLIKEIKPSVIGMGKRSSIQANIMAEKLLNYHMDDPTKASAIASSLNKNFYNHGHAVSRSEAVEMGLKVCDRDTDLEDLIWKVFEDFEDEMEMRTPFNASHIFLNDPDSQHLLTPPGFVNIPGNTPPQIQAQIWQNVISQIAVQPGNSIDFTLFQAAVESCRLGRRFTTEGKISGTLRPDLDYQVNAPVLRSGWVDA